MITKFKRKRNIIVNGTRAILLERRGVGRAATGIVYLMCKAQQYDLPRLKFKRKRNIIVNGTRAKQLEGGWGGTYRDYPFGVQRTTKILTKKKYNR
jgi:hypothetical protein